MKLKRKEAAFPERAIPIQESTGAAKRVKEIRDIYLHLKAQKKKLAETLDALEKALAHLRQEAVALGVDLPLTDEALSVARKAILPLEEKAKEGAQPARKKILVVDDDPVILRLIGYFLEKEGLTVVQAESAEEGIKKILEEKPNLLILDVMMPGMNGFQMLEKLQSYPHIPKPPVIFLSSLAEEEDVLRGLRAGWDYIIKPFSPAILIAKITNLLAIQNDSLLQRGSR